MDVQHLTVVVPRCLRLLDWYCRERRHSWKSPAHHQFFHIWGLLHYQQRSLWGWQDHILALDRVQDLDHWQEIVEQWCLDLLERWWRSRSEIWEVATKLLRAKCMVECYQAVPSQVRKRNSLLLRRASRHSPTSRQRMARVAQQKWSRARPSSMWVPRETW